MRSLEADTAGEGRGDGARHRRRSAGTTALRALTALTVAILAAAACGAGDAPAAADDPTTFVVTAELLERGETLYRRNCVPCHGDKGKGDGPAAPTLRPGPRDHTDRTYMDRLTDVEIAETIRFGGAPRGFVNMPSSAHLQGRDLAAVVAWVRKLSRGRDDVEDTEVEIR